jgi:LPXTG-motif cell wall-anchored protein
LVGAAGLIALLFALRGPARGAAAGVGSFGTTSAVLFGAALLSGIVLYFLRRKGAVMAIHAGIAIAGYVLLLAWNALG